MGRAESPLKVGGGGGRFDVTSLEAMMEGGVSKGQKALKIQKFKAPPRLERVQLEETSLESRPDLAVITPQFLTREAFAASKELNEFKLGDVNAWMPEKPKYKSHCTLQTHEENPFDTEGNIDTYIDDIDNRKRYDVNQITMAAHDNSIFEDTRSDEAHPRHKYLHDPAQLT